MATMTTGTVDSETIQGTSGDDYITAGAGNDTIIGDYGNDTLVGGAGDDFFKSIRTAEVTQIVPLSRPPFHLETVYYGDNGDTYLLAPGFGHDTIAESFASPSTVDTIRFEGDIGPANVDVAESQVDGRLAILMTLRATGDSVLFDITDPNDASAKPSTGIEVVQFADGTTWQALDILAKLSPPKSLTGTAGDDALADSRLNDTLIGLGGSDNISTAGGNDWVDAGDGDDLIRASIGADTLLGGAGQDTIVLADAKGARVDGGLGNDTIMGVQSALTVSMGLSSGHDVIRLSDRPGIDPLNVTTARAPSVVELASGISVAGSKVFVSAPNEITIEWSAGNGLTIQDFSTSQLSLLQADGVSTSMAQLQALATLTSIMGSTGADLVQGFSSNDTLDGLGGADTLVAGDGDDLIIGGAGDDLLISEARIIETDRQGPATQQSGSDVYFFDAGFGHDTIIEDAYSSTWPALGGGTDVIRMSAAFKPDDIAFDVVDDAHVLLRTKAGSNSILFNASRGPQPGSAFSPGIEFIEFADGTRLNTLDILQSRDKLVTGTAKKDALLGGAGNDTLDAGAGNDTLTGGLGNDRLIGGKGNDSYKYKRGDGQDVIVERDATLFNSDTLSIAGAARNQLWLTRAGNNLDISIIGTTNKITVDGWFASSANRVEKIQIDGGKTLNSSSVASLVNAMAAFQAPAAGAISMAPDVEAKLTRVLASSWR